MKKLFTLIFATVAFFVTSDSFACHDSKINSVAVVDNGNGTKTYTINVSIDVGNSDGYSLGFSLLFLGSSDVEVTNLGTQRIVRPGYDDLVGHYGATIGNTFPGSNTEDPFLKRYANRKDVVTFETPDNYWGVGSSDYNNNTIEVTVKGCVQTIKLDADFRTVGYRDGSVECQKTYSIPNLDVNCNLSVEDVYWEGFSIYPNPASTFLTLSNSNPIDAIEVFNTIGQSVLKQNSMDVTCILDISNLSNGFYTIKVNSNNKRKISRFIKQ